MFMWDTWTDHVRITKIQMQTIVCFSVTVKWLFKSKTWRKSQVWEQKYVSTFFTLRLWSKKFCRVKYKLYSNIILISFIVWSSLADMNYSS